MSDTEKAALELQIDELCAAVERLRKTAAMLASARTDLLAENAKLREQLAKARDPQRIGRQADPSSFIYAIEQLREFCWQHATNDEEAIPYINNVADAHERENAKLRDDRDGWKKVCVNQEVMHVMHEDALDNENESLRGLARDVWHLFTEHGAVNPCDLPVVDAVRDRMRELGIEVDG